MKKVTVGVLALQGSVAEHMHALSLLENVTPLEVKTPAALLAADGLILPGGESTTMSRLLNTFGLTAPLRGRIQNGMPVWGTCAGLILLAKEIPGETPHLAVMDITARRNAYGRQIDSFESLAVIPEVSQKEIPLIFIRAPWIDAAGEKVRVLCRINGNIVAARQEQMLATSFHPELTKDLSFHRYFSEMVSLSL